MLRPNTILGERFKIVRMIGSGGMATVYEAQHTGIGRRVAVKVLNQSAVTNKEIITRFEQEARAAGAIGHDNIVEVLDFGRYQKQPFIVMEYLAGESLGQRLDRMRMLPVPMACRIMDQVLAALEAVHQTGIIHRDLKPENVFLTTKAGITDFVKLLDFGVSKFTPQGGDLERSDTRTGVVMGTPHYMAPEQAFGRRDVDARVDIYAAGVLLYEMLTGTLPFDAENTADLLLSIAYHRPPPKHIRDHTPELSEELDAVVHKAIALEREHRFQDATAFRAALKTFLTEGGASRVGAVQTRRTVKRLDPRQEDDDEEKITRRPEAPPAAPAPNPAERSERGDRSDDFNTLVLANTPTRDEPPTNPPPAIAPSLHRAPELTEDTEDTNDDKRGRGRAASNPYGDGQELPTMPLDKLADQARAERQAQMQQALMVPPAPANPTRLSYEDMDSESPMPLVVRASSPKDAREEPARDEHELELELPSGTTPRHPMNAAPAAVPNAATAPDTADAPREEAQAPKAPATLARPAVDRGRLLTNAVLVAVALSVLLSAVVLAWHRFAR